MTRSIRVWTLLCGLFVCLSVLVPAARAESPKRVVVMDFRGPSNGVVRNHVVSALKARDEVEVVPEVALGGKTRGAGLRAAAAEAQVNALVEGRVAKKGKLLKVTISVRDASTGEVVKTEDWTKKKPQLASIRGAFWEALGPAILGTGAAAKPAEATKPAREPEPEDDVDEKPRAEQREEREETAAKAEAKAEGRLSVSDDEDEQDGEESAPERRVDGNPNHPALVASFGPRMMWRSLEYPGDTSLSQYSSYAKKGGSPAFNLALAVLWFPGAHKRSDRLSDIGVEADLDYSLLLKSKQGGKELDTTAYEFSAGLLYRIPLDAFEPRFRLGYVKHVFDVDVPTGTPLPAVSYSALRIGAGTVVNLLEAFNFDVGFSYLYVFDSGDIGSKAYASDLSTWAWELGAGATVRFKQVYGVRAGVDFRRYKLDFGKDNNAALVLPKNGTDDYLRATISFVYTLPGK